MNELAFKLFCPYQLAWGADRAGIKLGEKSRRIGWTYFDAFDATINRIGSHPTYNYDLWYSATDMTAAEEYIGYVEEFVGMVEAVATISDGEIEAKDEKTGELAKIKVMRATFANGLRITAGSSNPKFFRSKGGEVKLDELAFHDDGRKMFKAALLSARFWGYPLSAWSSHNGESSYFMTLVKLARAGKLKASVHRVDVLQAVEQGIVERIRMRRDRLNEIPAIDEKYRQEWLDERRAECPDEDVWNEEYMCIPSSDQSSLLSYALIQACEEQNLPLNEDLSKLKTSGTLYAGADIGRKHDLTSIWVDEIIGDVAWNRLLKRMKDVPFSVQLDIFSQLLQNPAVKRLCIDATGIGMMLAELLQQRFGKYRVEAVMFTAAVKSEIAMPFVRRFQDRNARIPADNSLRESLHAVRKIVTAANNIRLDAARDDAGHADEFWAGALCCHASDPLNTPLPAPLAEVPEAWL